MAATFGAVGLSASVASPLARGGTHIDYLTDYILRYSQVVNMFGGFWSASMRIRQADMRLEDWLEDGLMRHVDVRGPNSTTIFEGFVNEITVRRNGYSVRLGPLLNMANKTKLIYSTVDTTSGQSVVGIRGETAWQTDVECQERYGILEQVYSAGGLRVDEIAAVIGLQLQRACTPNKANDLTLPADLDSTEVEIEIAGYVRLLEKYIYNSTTYGTQQLDAKLTAVLNAEPNGIINVDPARIATNTMDVGAYDNDDRTAMSVIKGLVADGDASLNRYTFGILGNRTSVYEPISTVIDYVRAAHEQRQAVFTVDGGHIDPYYILPGRWLQQSDLMVGRKATSLQVDQRALLVESVRFTAPNSVAINGGESFKIDRKLAQLGLSGIGG